MEASDERFFVFVFENSSHRQNFTFKIPKKLLELSLPLPNASFIESSSAPDFVQVEGGNRRIIDAGVEGLYDTKMKHLLLGRK